jgi:uncharacterized protein (DUF488 family)
MSESPEPLTVLTIGHSDHSLERFIPLLRTAGVTAVADVRSSPYSRRQPQFNRERLAESLRDDGISYVFLGRELGGRPADPGFFCEGVADYERMAKADEFDRGIDRVVEGARRYRIALMCAEHDPLDCHRCLLVGRALAERGVPIGHILRDGAILPNAEIEERLLRLAHRGADDLFIPRAGRLAAAYRDRALKVAYARQNADSRGRQ